MIGWPRPEARQSGQGAVEFIVVFLLFAVVVLGLFEMTRVFRAKLTLQGATFAAARAGALHHALLSPMNAELANGMAVLHMQSTRSLIGIGDAQARARAQVNLPGIGIEIVSPTAAAYSAHARQQWVHRSDEADYRWQRVIPNDNLRWRPREARMIATADGDRPLHVQDANLLKVRALWCHRLVVPALDRAIFEIVSLRPFANERQDACTALSAAAGVAGIADGYYVAISSDAIVRMQSAVVEDDLP